MPTVSLIIPVYNVQNYLVACLDSVLSQTHKDFECICINDGSTDSSPAILQEYAQRDSRIIVISQQNKGVSEARNVGLKIAKAPYIQFLDPDDMLHPQALEILYGIIAQHDVDFVQCNCIRVQENFRLESPASVDIPQNFQLSRNVLDDFFKHKKNKQEFVWLRIYKAPTIRGGGIVFPSNVHPVEDGVYTIQVMSVAKSAIFIPEQLVYYRQHTASVMSKGLTSTYINSHFRAGEILHQYISDHKGLTAKQKRSVQKFIARKIFHPIRKTMHTVNSEPEKKTMLAELRQRLLELEKRGVFVPSDLRLRNRLAAVGFLRGYFRFANMILLNAYLYERPPQ